MARSPEHKLSWVPPALSPRAPDTEWKILSTLTQRGGGEEIDVALL